MIRTLLGLFDIEDMGDFTDVWPVVAVGDEVLTAAFKLVGVGNSTAIVAVAAAAVILLLLDLIVPVAAAGPPSCAFTAVADGFGEFGCVDLP